MVDWTKPIEAIHTDGRVVPIAAADTTKYTSVTWLVSYGWQSFIVNQDGQVINASDGWSIRNVAERPAWRTCDEQLDRMDALLARIVAAAGKNTRLPIMDENYVVSEAKAILAAREPVDPRFAVVMSAIVGSLSAPLADTTIMRMTRDVLAALDK